jgi:hypothetical protein
MESGVMESGTIGAGAKGAGAIESGGVGLSGLTAVPATSGPGAMAGIAWSGGCWAAWSRRASNAAGRIEAADLVLPGAGSAAGETASTGSDRNGGASWLCTIVPGSGAADPGCLKPDVPAGSEIGPTSAGRAGSKSADSSGRRCWAGTGSAETGLSAFGSTIGADWASCPVGDIVSVD